MTAKKTIDIVEKVLEESKKLDRKFKENIDLVFNLKNIDMNLPKNRIDQEVILPHGRGTEAKVAIFATLSSPYFCLIYSIILARPNFSISTSI